MRQATLPVARQLLASPKASIAELWVRPFEDDAAAHDDDLQAQLDRDFVTAFQEAQSELSEELGRPARFGQEHDEAVPLSGVFRFAIWSVGDQNLWLAAAHEDRECPFVLLLGTGS